MKLVAVVGPTATGKSALALALATTFDGEIVACDSTAVYRGIDIGTDKVPVAAQQGIPHHLVDVASVRETYSAARYAADAAAAIEGIRARGRLPILAGGTGFYYRALVRGLFPGPARDDRLRARLDRIAAHRGVESLPRWLARVDPESARRIQPRDRKRLVRALEVYLTTGRPLTTHFAATVSAIPGYDVLSIGLMLPRDALRERVAHRVDEQFARGVVDEVRRLLADGVPAQAHAFTGLVYRQVVEMLSGVRDERETRELIVRENLRYARRQLIWFRKEPNVRWLHGPGEAPDIQQAAIRLVSEFLNVKGVKEFRGNPRGHAPGMIDTSASSPDVSGVRRVLWIVMDSVGAGELPDAADYGDEGSDTLGNIARVVPLEVPALRSLGLARVANIGAPDGDPIGAFGRMVEASPGKDSVTGHWEMTGIVLDRPFPTFPRGFPPTLIDEFERRIGRRTIGNVVASGTAIIDALGPEHIKTGAPIVYTSADSVFQIAAHESVIPVDELYRICGIGFDLAARGMGIGRVIARPFIGTAGHFQRTANRRDFALEPDGETLLDRLTSAGIPVAAIGKIEDLFAGRGLTIATHTTSDDHGMDCVERELDRTPHGLIFVNLVDFDTLYGHRNDVAGYAANLERFDARLARLLPRLDPGDMLIVTADHGNDPTTPSTDHSREYVPLMIAGRGIRRGVDVGTRGTFADLGQTVADAFGVAPLAHGRSFWSEIRRPAAS